MHVANGFSNIVFFEVHAHDDLDEVVTTPLISIIRVCLKMNKQSNEWVSTRGEGCLLHVASAIPYTTEYCSGVAAHIGECQICILLDPTASVTNITARSTPREKLKGLPSKL